MAYNILVVDDSKVTRSMIRNGISQSGTAVEIVFEASNGREALRKLSEERIDIVFTDLDMPDMDGKELIQRMSESTKMGAIPIVVVSSNRSTLCREELERIGIRAYLTKPCRADDFREVFHVLFGKKA